MVVEGAVSAVPAALLLLAPGLYSDDGRPGLVGILALGGPWLLIGAVTGGVVAWLAPRSAGRLSSAAGAFVGAAVATLTTVGLIVVPTWGESGEGGPLSALVFAGAPWVLTGVLSGLVVVRSVTRPRNPAATLR